MKKYLILAVLSLALTSFKATENLKADFASKRISGIWVNLDKTDPIRLFKFFPTGLLNIHNTSNNLISQYWIDSFTPTSITGKMQLYPMVIFTAVFDKNEEMDLSINYEGEQKTLHLVKTKDIKSGASLLSH